MHSETIEPQLAALTATLKVLARLAPHARHDVIGVSSLISLDISVLSAKSVKRPLTTADVDPFVERSKTNVRNIVEQLDRFVLFQRQDRSHLADVKGVVEQVVRSMRSVFDSVQWDNTGDQVSLGTDSEYDLTMALWATLLAMHDKHGTNKALCAAVKRDQDGLMFVFSVAPAAEDSWTALSAIVPDQQRIAVHEARHLVEQLDFRFTANETGIILRRVAATPGAEPCRRKVSMREAG